MGKGRVAHRRKSDPLAVFRAMKKDNVVVPAVYEDCKLMVALEFIGLFPDDIDTKLGWEPGKAASLRSLHPIETREAEDSHMEQASRKYKQAQIRLYELLGNSVETTVLFCAQIVQGGGDNITARFKSDLVREVNEEEASITARLKASETILKFTQFIYSEAKKNAVDPATSAMAPLPESFVKKVEAAVGSASNLRLVRKPGQPREAMVADIAMGEA
jgi:hypothetical protein